MLARCSGDCRPKAAAFAVAGPVKNKRCVMTNLGWIIDAGASWRAGLAEQLPHGLCVTPPLSPHKARAALAACLHSCPLPAKADLHCRPAVPAAEVEKEFGIPSTVLNDFEAVRLSGEGRAC